MPPPRPRPPQFHADRRQSLVFDEQLRLYPDASGLVPQHAAHLAFAGQLRAIAASVDERCGGLLHLELAENKVGAAMCECV